MRKRSGQVHSRESSATLQLTVSLLYPYQKMNIANNVGICYTMPRQEMRLVSKLAQSETPRMAVRGVSLG